MKKTQTLIHLLKFSFFILITSFSLNAQRTAPNQEPSRANILRGEYGRYRANNDLLYYHLDVRVDPDKKFLKGTTTARIRMLKEDSRIQLDLHEALKVDGVFYDEWEPKPRAGGTSRLREELKFTREAGALFVDFPQPLIAGHIYEVAVNYSGNPLEQGRFGGIAFKRDPAGRPWINTACEGEGASVWWPNKDQWRDEVESMKISVSIPNDLVDVSNGKFLGKTDLVMVTLVGIGWSNIQSTTTAFR